MQGIENWTRLKLIWDETGYTEEDIQKEKTSLDWDKSNIARDKKQRCK